MASSLTQQPAGRHSAASDEEAEINTDTMRWCGCGCGRLQGGGCRRPRPQVAALCAEAAGTALLVTLSCLATCSEGELPLAHRALAAGLVVAVVVQCFDHVSGAQVNPTVTLAAALAGHQPWAAAAAEAAAQLAGGVAGAGLVRLLPGARLRADGYCVTRPAHHVPLYKAVWYEAILGACLALANCASWDARNRYLRDSWPIRIGLIVAALSFVAGDATGASMNPARSFGPALWSGVWTDHWVYWCGPLAGSAAATLVYRAVWRAPPHAAGRGHPAPPADPPPCKTHSDA